MWRLLIGLGCVPGALALYFRLTIPETPRFTMDIERNVDQVRTLLSISAKGAYDVVGKEGHRAVPPDGRVQV